MSEAPHTSPACPQCQSPIAPGAVQCAVCGSDLGLLTLLAEYALVAEAAREELQARQPPSVELLVPRLGQYLVSEGLVSEADLQTALASQAAAGAGRPRLGQTLVQMGVLSREQLDQVVAEQILQLHDALLEANRTLERRVAQRTAELEAALVKLTELNQLKANFVANISHELRTPLAKIKGYNALLLDGTLGSVTPDQHTGLQVTARAVDQLEQLVNDLIAYSQTARGELTLRLQPVDARVMLQVSLDRMAAKAQRKQVQLDLQCSALLPPILADEGKLQWVLTQLLDNAVKFTPAGGQVTLRAAPRGGRVWLSVQDTGIGIPADRLEEVFEPFQQLDGSASRRYGGTGLGLALVRRIVEAHGSVVSVESQVNQGSTFSFDLAVATPPPE